MMPTLTMAALQKLNRPTVAAVGVPVCALLSAASDCPPARGAPPTPRWGAAGDAIGGGGGVRTRRGEQRHAEARRHLPPGVEDRARPARVLGAYGRERRSLDRDQGQRERPAAGGHNEPDPPLD